MSQITQVAQSTLATVHREFRAFARYPATDQSEHWQVVHSEQGAQYATEQRVRRTAVVIASVCAALLVASCNVYDTSLLGVDPQADGGRAGGSIFTGGGASDGGSGSVGAAAGNFGDAGAATSWGGADAAGAPNTVAGSGGFSGPTAGTGGSSGAGEVAGAPAGGAGSLTLSVIDDMEMPDPNIPATDMRAGFWSLSNVGTGTQTPPTMVMSTLPMARGTSLHALHTATTGFQSSVIGVDLNRKGAVRATYDASAYKAVHFFAKVEASSATAMHFALLDKHTDPDGMLCCPTKTTCKGTQDYAANGLCYDHFAKDLVFTTSWAEYTIPFSDLNQIGWGLNMVDALDAAHVFNIQFSWGPDPMNLWIDDISFVKK